MVPFSGPWECTTYAPSDPVTLSGYNVTMCYDHSWCDLTPVFINKQFYEWAQRIQQFRMKMNVFPTNA